MSQTPMKLEIPLLQPGILVVLTPDAHYPIGVLRAYRKECNRFWLIDSCEDERYTPFFREWNKDLKERAKILDKAIEILEKNLSGGAD